MGLETGTYVDDLVVTNPPGGDDKRQGDDHLRLIKTVLKNTIKRGSKPFYLPGSVSKSAGYLVLESDENLIFQCDTTAQFNLNLPTLDSSRAGWQIFVIKTTTDANGVYMVPPSGTINGYAYIRRSVLGTITQVLWTGTVWVASRPFGAPVGTVLEYYGSTLPQGHLWANGAAFTAANYLELNTAYGAAVTPDRRGRAAFGRDDMGGSAASRITSAGSSIVGTTLQAAGGVQNVVVAKANLAVGETLSASGLSWTQSTTSTSWTQGSSSFTGANANLTSPNDDWLRNTGSNNVAAGTGASDVKTGGNFGSIVINYTPAGTIVVSGTVGVSMAGTISGTVSTGGSSVPLTNMPPTLICNAIVVAE
jgi:hypothetical protein